MNPLIEALEQNSMYPSLIEEIKKEKNKISVIGFTDSAKAHVVYTNFVKTDKSVLLICSNNNQATKLICDLKFFCEQEIVYFPARNFEYYDVEAESKEIENQRTYAIDRILNKDKKIVVTTIDACLMRMFPHVRYVHQNLLIKKGQTIKLNHIVEQLEKLGYERDDTVEGKGQYALRGGILDVFSLQADTPYRIEFFGDEVDNVRTFDPLTQRSLDTLHEIELSYVSENMLTSDKLTHLIDKLDELVDTDISLELKHTILEDKEKIENGLLPNLFDKYFGALSEVSETLFDYLENYLIYIDEPSKCIEKANNVRYENIETLKVLAERNYLYLPYANHYLDFDEILVKLSDFTSIYLERLDTQEKVANRKVFYFDFKEENFYKNSLDVLVKDIHKSRQLQQITLLVFPTFARCEQIKNYLLDSGIHVEFLEILSLKEKLIPGQVYITKGILSSGFKSQESRLFVVAETVSGVNTKVKKLKKTSIGTTINSFEDLEVGNYVVHENHGIGMYRGIKTITVQDVQKDYIIIEYDKKGVLYVPISQLDSVRKYVCDDDTVPKLNSLSGKEWEKTKHKVQTHVKEIAKELMLLYAKREKMQGYAFSEDSPWQKEFEDSFEYELTTDQKHAIEEIKADMQTNKPMDRLLCGDVGYGKTEVALRAAFKAVVDSKQVAYLVPTTVLSLQQYRTFKYRMEEFGIRVEMLSRFRNPKEQKQILKDLVDGKIDVIVGTHRLLSKDIFFKDLGLLIIDEEHRFGVKAKEAIKQLKETIDVLSMTATPIPRTLHMSMIGIRQMSTLTEPPMERLPVHTYVLEYEPNVIQNAIEKELLRDGQVFYISNRVSNIEAITEKVRNMVPEARVAYAHGQMEPEMIEEIMLKFMEHEIDVLICTTILESGIDIQNANTIIVENADKLGLAQLYQIRGRVGRSNRLAYAYITYEKNKQLSEVSEKRLKAIKDFTEFGSGFKIALRDLEIRGAGNMLGREQHGHMAKVGYEMYLALLEKAIQEEKDGNTSKNGVLEIEQDVKIELNVSAYISDQYIKNPMQKIAMYQRISDIKNKEEMLDVIDELLDRYGDIPKETENLIKIVEIRNAARKLGITKISDTLGILKFEPLNLKYSLTNISSNDILIRVQLEINKLLKIKEKG